MEFHQFDSEEIVLLESTSNNLTRRRSELGRVKKALGRSRKSILYQHARLRSGGFKQQIVVGCENPDGSRTTKCPLRKRPKKQNVIIDVRTADCKNLLNHRLS